MKCLYKEVWIKIRKQKLDLFVLFGWSQASDKQIIAGKFEISKKIMKYIYLPVFTRHEEMRFLAKFNGDSGLSWYAMPHSDGRIE